MWTLAGAPQLPGGAPGGQHLCLELKNPPLEPPQPSSSPRNHKRFSDHHQTQSSMTNFKGLMGEVSGIYLKHQLHLK